MMKVEKVENVVPHDDFSLTVTFNDGLIKHIDIKPFIRNGVSSALKSNSFFKM